jgi:hypothetical protein
VAFSFLINIETSTMCNAQNDMFQAVYYFEQEDYEKSLKGDGALPHHSLFSVLCSLLSVLCSLLLWVFPSSCHVWRLRSESLFPTFGQMTQRAASQQPRAGQTGDFGHPVLQVQHVGQLVIMDVTFFPLQECRGALEGIGGF